jgi:hypothetical protein
MQNIIARGSFCALLGLAWACGNKSRPESNSPLDVSGVTLPIEVIGPDGYTEAVTFDLAGASDVDRLFIQCHRCGYRDSSVNQERGAKGSVRLNDGDWIDIDDQNADVLMPEKGYGGIAGGFHTVRMTIPVAGAVVGANKLEFRFNKTDGFSDGFRILKFNLQRAGQNVLADALFRDDNPSLWLAPLNTPDDIAKGRELWTSAVLDESPVSNREINATCSSCHAVDGRDLKYFNYSNWSIQERSKFHGLSDVEGKQIASYIRSLNAPAPAQARPWNPPYQPGPGLDARPIEQWAAGAGVDAVLDNDQAMLPYLFPAGTTQSDIDAVASIKGTLNMRELPISLQLPDWNDWLPEVHPTDLWGASFNSSDAIRTYQQVRQQLASGASDAALIDLTESVLLAGWTSVFTYMGGPIPCVLYHQDRKAGTAEPQLMDQLPAGKTCEDGLQSINHWLAVKNWEMFHTFSLEGKASSLYPYGEQHGWFGAQRNVFEVASHRSSDNGHFFKHQTQALGSYHSNVWYQLQLILNAGNRDPYTFFPQDWFYTPMFIAINSRDNRQPLALLNAAMHIKMYQNLDMTGPDGRGADRGAGFDGWYLPFVNVWRFESTIGWEEADKWEGSISADGRTSKGFPWTHLDAYDPGLRVKVTNALLRQFLNKTRSYTVAGLPRREARDDGNYFEAADYVVPTEIPDAALDCFYNCPGEDVQARSTYRAMYRFREMGVDEGLRFELIDLMAALFPDPRNNWDALR